MAQGREMTVDELKHDFTNLARECVIEIKQQLDRDETTVKYKMINKPTTSIVDDAFAVGMGALTGGVTYALTFSTQMSAMAGKGGRDVVQKSISFVKDWIEREKAKKRFAALGPCEFECSRAEAIVLGVVEFLSLYEAQISTLASHKKISNSTISAKIAADLVERILDYFVSNTAEDKRTNVDFVKAGLFGKSKIETRNTLLKKRYGKTIKLENGTEWNTGKMFDLVGINGKNEEIYELGKSSKATKYGCRRLAQFEDIDTIRYTKSDNQDLNNNYIYKLDSKLLQQVVDEVLQEYKTPPKAEQDMASIVKCWKNSLASLGGDGTIKIYQQSTASNSPRTKAISFGVMQPTTFFTGRDDEVQQLSELFLSQCPPKILVISGMGGQGKTELCRQFIQTLKTKNSPPALTWLSADNATNLTSSILQLAQSLQILTIEGKPTPLTQLIVQVGDNISNSSVSGWLVVIDNVDKVYPEFRLAVDLLVRHGAFVVITTRKIDVLAGGGKQMKLDVMKEEDAHKLVRKCLNQPPIEEDVTDLCQELGNHALAIRQAVAYINAQQVVDRTSFGIKDYLNDFNKDKISLFNQNDHAVDGYSQTIYLILTRTMKTIQDGHGRLGKTAAQLMEILGFIRADGISVACLQKFQTILDQESDRVASTNPLIVVDLHQTLLLLKKYSLITYNDGIVVSIHRLVQKVVKSHNRSSASIRTILKTIDPVQCSREELQQVLHFWEQASTEIVKERPNLPNVMFDRMIDLSLIQELIPFAEKNHALLTKFLEPDNECTLDLEHNMAFALTVIGDYEGALTKFKEVLGKKKGIFGENHPSTLATGTQLALAYYYLGKFGDALEWNKRVLDSQLNVLGATHKDTMTTRHNMALVLTRVGRTDEALTLMNQVLEWRMKNQGHSHPRTLATRHNMATILHGLGRLEEASKELEDVLKLRTEVLGEEHAATLLTKGWLATTLWKLGRREEALKMKQGVFVSREKVLGPNHPTTIITRNQIAHWIKSV